MSEKDVAVPRAGARRRARIIAIGASIGGVCLLFTLFWLSLGGTAAQTATDGVTAMAPDDLYNFVADWVDVQDTTDSNSVAFGDVDGDGDLDAAFGNDAGAGEHAVVIVYNVNGALDSTTRWESADTGDARAVAWADYDGDGDLDLAAAVNGQANRLYVNNGGVLNTTPQTFSADADASHALAWGDIDGNGELDLVVGNVNQPNKVYFNNGGALGAVAGWTSADSANTRGIDLGDINGDGLIDLAVANNGQSNQIFFNTGVTFNTAAGWSSTELDATGGVALGDLNLDGLPDMAAANGINVDQPNRIYYNTGTTLETTASWISDPEPTTTATPLHSPSSGVALGDLDADGDLDVAFSNNWFNDPERVHYNEAGVVNTTSGWNNNPLVGAQARGLALADVNGDGMLELALAVGNTSNQLYINDFFFIPTATEWTSNPTSLFASTWGIAWADVNADGFLDLVTGNLGQNEVNLFAGDAVTTTSAPFSPDSVWTRDIAAGDMNGDGYVDIAAANQGFGSAGNNTVYLGGPGGLSPTAAWTAAENEISNAAAWADVEGDGDLDLAVANINAPDRVYFNTGTMLATTAAWVSPMSEDSSAVAWGDVDGDGDPDLITGHLTDTAALKLYLNDGGVLDTVPSWTAADAYFPSDIAVGDLNADGIPDLVAISSEYQPIRVYYGTGTGFGATSDSQTLTSPAADGVTLADFDSDGDLDVAVAGIALAQIYLNENGALDDTPAWEASDIGDTRMLEVAAADADRDGDIDLAISALRNGNFPNRIYYNSLRDGGLNFAASIVRPATTGADRYSAARIIETPTIPITFTTFDAEGLPLGRVEAEFSLDGGGTWLPATAAAGSDTELLASEPFPTIAAANTHVFLWDTAADGVFGLNDQVVVRLRGVAQVNGGAPGSVTFDGSIAGPFQVGAMWSQTMPFRVRGTQVNVSRGPVAHWTFEQGAGSPVADQSGYGHDLFLFGGASYNSAFVPTLNYPNQYALNFSGFNNAVFAADSDALDVTEFAVGGWVRPTVSQPDWQPLIVKEDANGANRNFGLYLHPNAPETVFASFAHGDCVTYSNLTSVTPLTLNDWNHVMMTYDGATYKLFINGELDASAPLVTDTCLTDNAIKLGYEVFTFSDFVGQMDDVRIYDYGLTDAQVALLADGAPGVPAANAIVYRLPAGQASGAEAIGSVGQPFTTDANGYLQGRGQINLGDTLYALYPVESAAKYTLYHTSGTPTAAGVDGHVVSAPGVQNLTVSANRPLLLFNVDMSLEWDARNDGAFLGELDNAIDNASALMFDASNGQIALGDVRVYQDKENWLGSDVIMFASRGIRPMANIGGLVDTSTNDVISATKVISDAFAPGQVRVGPNWDPFGSNAADLGVDWQRAFAHELSHYLLYLPDNYIGIVNGTLAYVDCFGSLMTNTYDDDYSEYLRRPEWNADADCLTTVAERETERTDWDTITQYYPALAGTPGTTEINSGPAILPLDLADLDIVDPAGAPTTLPVRTYDLRAAEGDNALLAIPRAEGYLQKTNGTTGDFTDDSIVPLGAAGGGGDRLVVRGAAVGDRVCVYDAESNRLGCTTVTETSVAVLLDQLPAWKPDIQVSPVSSVTVDITVTLPSAEAALNLLVVPAYGSVEAPDTIVPFFGTMSTADGGTTFTRQVTLSYPAFEGTIRVWAPGSTPTREVVSQYFLNSEFWGGNQRTWGGNQRTWGGNQRAWGGNQRAWGAPTTSGDGQVSVFNADAPFEINGISSLQALPSIPELPLWLTAVGNGYRVIQEAGYNATGDNRVISFNYLQSQVPPGYEFALHIYRSADNGQTWQRQETIVDTYQNLATAALADPADGLYALLATVDVPPFAPGWNNFGYPIPETRPIETALASIEGFYETVYFYQAAAQTWRAYDTTWAQTQPQWNDLTELSFANAYWISVTEAITLFLGVPGQGTTTVAPGGVQLPPASFYGSVAGVNLQPGTPIQAFVGSELCGASTIEDFGGGLVYRVHVSAETIFGAPNGCGAAGRDVTFIVAGQPYVVIAPWGASGVRLLDLDFTMPPTAVTQVTAGATSGAWAAPAGALIAALLLTGVAWRRRRRVRP